jgi:hypothetical protein
MSNAASKCTVIELKSRSMGVTDLATPDIFAWRLELTDSDGRLTLRANRYPTPDEREELHRQLKQRTGVEHYVSLSWFATLAPRTYAWPSDHPDAIACKRDDEEIVAKLARR